MREYVRPMMTGETFATNEYVAACFMLACHRGSKGNPYVDSYPYWDGPERGKVSHSPIGTADTCGDASANRVITSEGGLVQNVGEYNGQQGWLNGVYTHWIDNGKEGEVDPGDIIFWYTTASDGRKWNHWGVVQPEDPSHPNHS